MPAFEKWVIERFNVKHDNLEDKDYVNACVWETVANGDLLDVVREAFAAGAAPIKPRTDTGEQCECTFAALPCRFCLKEQQNEEKEEHNE